MNYNIAQYNNFTFYYTKSFFFAVQSFLIIQNSQQL